MKQKYGLLLIIGILIFASLACEAVTGSQPADGNDQSTPEPSAPTEAIEPTTPPSKSPVEPATMSSQGPGMMCIGSSMGITCLDDSGWHFYNEDNSDIPSDYPYTGAVCPDGRFLIAHFEGFSLFDGKEWANIPDADSISNPEGVACGADGEVWSAHFQGVSHYVNGQWTEYSAADLASGESANDLVYDIEIAPDGKVWVVTSRSVAYFENDAWTVFQEGQGFNSSRFFQSMTLDAKGRVWAAHSNGVDIYDNGEWKSIDKTDYNSPESIAIDTKGQVWLATISDGAFVFDGSTWKHANRESEKLKSDSVSVVAADSAGRVWFGTTYGLTVFDGSNYQTYQMHNSGLGDNDISFILIVKDGPALPALEDKPLGSITGTLEDTKNQPMPNKKVEICVETLGSTYYGDTPCSDQPFFLSTTTDANGVFLIENVPAGYYVIVSETETGWAQLTDQFGISSERTLINAGEAYDVGTLTLQD